MKDNTIKNKALLFSIFGAGILSVSIANFFGGFYCSVAAIVVILATFYLFGVLDNRSLKEEKVNLGMIGLVALFEIIFFIVNDIVGYDVYIKGSVSFIGGLVIASQVYSVIAILYHLIMMDVNLLKSKNSVEIIEKENVEKNEEETSSKESLFTEDADYSNVEDIRQIPRNEVRKEAPFMEEEK